MEMKVTQDSFSKKAWHLTSLRHGRSRSVLAALSALCAAASMASPAHAAGGRGVGNGGDAVVCRNAQGAIQRIELLDHYEGRTLYGAPVDLGPAHLPVDEKLEIAIARIAEFSPARAGFYRHLAAGFMKEANFIEGATLEDVPDSHHAVFPSGCKVEQLAIQRAPRFARDSRYLINADLWKAMDHDARAGLVLHEAIYRETIDACNDEQGVPRAKGCDSTPARYLSAMAASGQLKSLTAKEFAQTIEQLDSAYQESSGILLHKPADGDVVRAAAYPQTQGLPVAGIPEVPVLGTVREAEFGPDSAGSREFWSFGVLDSWNFVMVAEPFEWTGEFARMMFRPRQGFQRLEETGGWVFWLGERHATSLTYLGKSLTVKGVLRFHANGRISQMTLAGPFAFAYRGGEITLIEGSFVKLDSEGRIEYFHAPEPVEIFACGAMPGKTQSVRRAKFRADGAVERYRDSPFPGAKSQLWIQGQSVSFSGWVGCSPEGTVRNFSLYNRVKLRDARGNKVWVGGNGGAVWLDESERVVPAPATP